MAPANPLLDPSARPIIAHRGASAHAPENTLPAFELALSHGADAFELDVRLSRDGAPVVMHDATLERTTGLTGPVRAHTLAELRMTDAGRWFTPDAGRTLPFRDRGVRIPTLAEVLWAFPGMPVLIEVKEPEVQEAVRRVLVDQDACERCVVASEDDAALTIFREGPVPCGASARDITELYLAVLLRRRLPRPRYRLLSVPLRHRGLPVPTRRFVAAARRLGCPVHVWTVNDPATARRLWARGVAGVVTNVPGEIGPVRPPTSS
jgi:glycerophosphoryl diester phosphodiesterase